MCTMGVSAPSLHRKSTDSLIYHMAEKKMVRSIFGRLLYMPVPRSLPPPPPPKKKKLAGFNCVKLLRAPPSRINACAVYIFKYEKHLRKMYKDVGMAVPKPTQTR